MVTVTKGCTPVISKSSHAMGLLRRLDLCTSGSGAACNKQTQIKLQSCQTQRPYSRTTKPPAETAPHVSCVGAHSCIFQTEVSQYRPVCMNRIRRHFSSRQLEGREGRPSPCTSQAAEVINGVGSEFRWKESAARTSRVCSAVLCSAALLQLA